MKKFISAKPVKRRRRKTAPRRRNVPKRASHHISSTSIDIDLKTSEERWQSLLDNPIFGVTFLGEHHRFITTSRTFQNMVGYSDEELRLLTPLDISVPGEREINANFFSEMRQGKRQHYEMIKQLRRKNGKLIWVQLYVFAITDRKSGIQLPFGIVFDITERKQAQDALQETRTELAHVARVATLGQLTASITHEIRQPIAAARNNATAALNFLDAQPPDLREVREALGCVVEDTDRAGAIVDRILDQIKKALPQKDRFDLNEAINQVVVWVQGEITKNRVSVDTHLTEVALPVQGDRVQLQQVVLNLILNALEAMGSVQEGPRELSISTEQAQGNGFLVTVRDTGPGIDPENIERVFEAFYTTKSSGVGMGLSICRSIIDAHGGRLWADMRASRGAVFRFTLPG
jgi:PAS domain S-box-containing protein